MMYGLGNTRYLCSRRDLGGTDHTRFGAELRLFDSPANAMKKWHVLEMVEADPLTTLVTKFLIFLFLFGCICIVVDLYC